MKINNLRGDLTDISAKKDALVRKHKCGETYCKYPFREASGEVITYHTSIVYRILKNKTSVLTPKELDQVFTHVSFINIITINVQS